MFFLNYFLLSSFKYENHSKYGGMWRWGDFELLRWNSLQVNDIYILCNWKYLYQTNERKYFIIYELLITIILLNDCPNFNGYTHYAIFDPRLQCHTIPMKFVSNSRASYLMKCCITNPEIFQNIWAGEILLFNKWMCNMVIKHL